MLQYEPKERLDINDLAKHKFLTLNPNEFTPLNIEKVHQRFSNNDLTLNSNNITQSVLSIFETEKYIIPNCILYNKINNIKNPPLILKRYTEPIENIIKKNIKKKKI